MRDSEKSQYRLRDGIVETYGSRADQWYTSAFNSISLEDVQSSDYIKTLDVFPVLCEKFNINADGTPKEPSRLQVALKLLNEWRTAANNVDAPNAFESTRTVWRYEEFKLRNEILELMGVDEPETPEETAEREEIERLRAEPGDNVLDRGDDPPSIFVSGLGEI